MTKRKRGEGPRLNDLQRLEIIRKHRSADPPLSLRQLARDFCVNEKTIRRVMATAAEIEARASASAILNLRGQVHRRAVPRFPALERSLLSWIDACQRARADISPSVVIDKAKLVARAMGIPPDEFKASWGWYDKFSRRYGIRTAFMGSQEYKVQETKTLQDLHNLMQEYDPECVFTVEETPIFYNVLPYHIEEVIMEERNRVTLVVSCNSTGRIKLPICMVGKEKWPIKGQSGRNTAGLLNLPYLVQEKAWLDRVTFGKWYSSVFVPFVREKTSKRVLLVVDGERPGHQGDFEEGGIRAVFLPRTPLGSVDFPTNLPIDLKIWWKRPLQMSVFVALKARYKYLLVQSALSYFNAPQEVKMALKAAEKNIEGCSGGIHFGHKPTLIDAARLLDQAWTQVPDDLLENCFARANLVPPSKLLAAPAAATGSEIIQEPNATLERYIGDITSKMVDMLNASSLLDRDGVRNDQNTSASALDRVCAFLNVDDDTSLELQQQMQQEIDEVLSDEIPAVLTPNPIVQVLPTTVPDDEKTDHPQSDKTDLASQIHGLLLGITDVATQLRLLPQTGTDGDKLAPLQLESCIAAADEIRHCIQSFDQTLRLKSSEQKKVPVDDNKLRA